MEDNTASQWDFQPALRSFAGILVTGLDIELHRSVTVVFRCDWTQLPDRAATGP